MRSFPKTLNPVAEPTGGTPGGGLQSGIRTWTRNAHGVRGATRCGESECTEGTRIGDSGTFNRFSYICGRRVMVQDMRTRCVNWRKR